MAAVYVVGTLDTKGVELRYLRDVVARSRSRGDARRRQHVR